MRYADFVCFEFDCWAAKLKSARGEFVLFLEKKKNELSSRSDKWFFYTRIRFPNMLPNLYYEFLYLLSAPSRHSLMSFLAWENVD